MRWDLFESIFFLFPSTFIFPSTMWPDHWSTFEKIIIAKTLKSVSVERNDSKNPVQCADCVCGTCCTTYIKPNLPKIMTRSCQLHLCELSSILGSFAIKHTYEHSPTLRLYFVPVGKCQWYRGFAQLPAVTVIETHHSFFLLRQTKIWNEFSKYFFYSGIHWYLLCNT